MHNIGNLPVSEVTNGLPHMALSHIDNKLGFLLCKSDFSAEQKTDMDALHRNTPTVSHGAGLYKIPPKSKKWIPYRLLAISIKRLETSPR